MGNRFNIETGEKLCELLKKTTSSIMQESIRISGDFMQLGDSFKDALYEKYHAEITQAENAISDVVGDLQSLITGLKIYTNEMRELLEEKGNCSADTGSAESVSQVLPQSDSGQSTTASYELSNATSSTFESMKSTLTKANVDYRAIEPAASPRTTEEIISRISGGDETIGSCSSLALAYIGNVAGYDVLDFRDGNSREFFSSRDSIDTLCKLPGVKYEKVCVKNDFKSAELLLDKVVEGKEYYFAVGEHAAIVKKEGPYYKYLELQGRSDKLNGWKDLGSSESLDTHVLYDRFGCDERCEITSFLIDVDSLKHNNEFLNILGYINTAESEQRKGSSGYAK